MTVLVYITVGSQKEAEKIADVLVGERLVACANLLPIRSVYRWKGKLTRDDEFLLLCKTARKKFKKIEQRVLGIHTYETPAITALPILSGNQKFLKWVKESTE